MLNIISNPFAGKGKAGKTTKKIIKLLKQKKVEFLVYFSEKQGDIKAFTSKLFEKGERTFIIIGGDGTINEVINAIDDLTECRFGIIPAGQCNNFAKTLGFKTKIDKTLSRILTDEVLAVDYLLCNDRKAVNTISLGLSSEVLKNFHSKNKFKLLYFFSALKKLKKYAGIELIVKADDVEYEKYTYDEIAVCNGEFYGCNIRINPYANVTDKSANIMMFFSSADKKGKNLISLFNGGKHIYREDNKQMWAKTVEISNEENALQVCIDGELAEFEKAKIEIVPASLNILIKKD